MIDDSYGSGAKHYDAAYSVKEDLVDRDFYLDRERNITTRHTASQ